MLTAHCPQTQLLVPFMAACATAGWPEVAEQRPDSKDTLTTGSPAKKHKPDVAASPSFGSGLALAAKHAGMLSLTRCSLPDNGAHSGSSVATSTKGVQVLQCSAGPCLEQG